MGLTVTYKHLVFCRAVSWLFCVLFLSTFIVRWRWLWCTGAAWYRPTNSTSLFTTPSASSTSDGSWHRLPSRSRLFIRLLPALPAPRPHTTTTTFVTSNNCNADSFNRPISLLFIYVERRRTTCLSAFTIISYSFFPNMFEWLQLLSVTYLLLSL